MKHSRSLLPAFLLILILLGCTGRAAKPGRRAGALITPIADIVDNPQRFANEIVTVKGVVSDAMGVFSTSMFKLTDRTGASIHIWCPTSMAPNDGERIKVKGEVHLVYRFRKYSFCYIKQLQKD